MTATIVGFAALLVLAFAGVPLGFAMLLVGIIGFASVRAGFSGHTLLSWDAGGLHVDWPSLNAANVMAGQQIFDVSTSHGLTVIPLFVLMGAFIHRADLSRELYSAANAFLGHHRGGLAMATIAASAGFSAVSGSSVASAATMARVAMPPMRQFGYGDSLSAGSVAAGGTLGILIPPSVPLVLYGILAETDIRQLFIAGIIPGLLLALLFIASITLVTWLQPNLGPRGVRAVLSERLRQLRQVWGVGLIFLLIIGGMYLGVFTATEAAGVGAAGAFAFALLRRRLTWRVLFEALVESGQTTGMIFIVTIAALIFSNFISLSGFTGAAAAWISGFDASVLGVVVAMCAIYLVLGCFFDSLAMLLLTVPVFTGILVPLGADLVWFGIVVIISVEMGLITPPIGMNAFVVSAATPGLQVWTVFRGIWPFLLAMLLCLALIILVPSIATGLPDLMLTGGSRN